uniref:Claudin n=1 Tax=Panagrellus redivivus TaxID=6233 RepID=A0A7E4W5R7_PANRE
MFLTNLYLGIAVMLMQIVPLFFQNWLYVTEPRPLNLTDEKGELVEAEFEYEAGYFQVCRTLGKNFTTIKNLEHYINAAELRRWCHWNSIYTEIDLSDFSFATNMIMIRLGVPTLMHIVGAVLCVFGFVIGVIGYSKRNSCSIISAIFYVIGGLTVAMAILQFVCVVDDEMAPRMKLNAAGEPSLFAFCYGYAFLAAALSFMPTQLCVYLQTQIYFGRYPSPQDKSEIVPGLDDLLAEVKIKERYSLRRQTGSVARSMSPQPPEHCYYNSSRRSTRTSRDFAAYSIQRELPLSPPFPVPSQGREMACY